ncbi:MAG: undecaprenyldiphospho-muramoylpentapeptide beta-N-acetylglucosaminyltransferase [Candidatus Omnitrophota bacterium]
MTAANRASEERRGGTVVVTGGGTGGHLYPAIAVAQALRRKRPVIGILFIGREAEKDRAEVEKKGIDFVGLKLEGLQRRISLTNLRSLAYAAGGLWRCLRMMKRYPKGVVFGVGGYVSAPAMVAGKILGWRVTMHEQNTIPGLVNRIMAPWCASVFITYEETKKWLKDTACEWTGFPLRRELIERRRQASVAAKECPGILVIGGSQGARKLVETGLEALKRLDEANLPYRAVVQAGERNYEWAQTLGAPQRAELVPFIHDMPEAYAAADIVVSRAGSGSLAEIALWGRPSILVPYPFASENHQQKNAEVFAQRGAARLIPENELTTEALSEALAGLLRDEEKRKTMSARALELARDDAADRIAEEILRWLEA